MQEISLARHYILLWLLPFLIHFWKFHFEFESTVEHIWGGPGVTKCSTDFHQRNSKCIWPKNLKTKRRSHFLYIWLNALNFLLTQVTISFLTFQRQYIKWNQISTIIWQKKIKKFSLLVVKHCDLIGLKFFLDFDYFQ